VLSFVVVGLALSRASPLPQGLVWWWKVGLGMEVFDSLLGANAERDHDTGIRNQPADPTRKVEP
jgi:hypothetical protein